MLAGLLATVMLASALLPTARAGAATMPCGESNAAPSTLSLHVMRTSVLCLMNRVRVHHNLRPLTYNQDLKTSASAHSVSMVVHGYFAHEGPGGSVDSRVSRSGYLAGNGAFTVGENIAAGAGNQGSPWQIFQDWMHSPPHRANILDPHYRDAGVGVARGYPLGGGGDAATYTVDFGAVRN
ncbi:MAG: CAP domain-containing protein [Actinobacteria bacterium]|nr:CAP domain-containing protein [Actinomycetota bacterium]OJU86201.1 MAG: hypothetical protein BGO11_18770 [Solirubrobacterales bacterium 70-9]